MQSYQTLPADLPVPEDDGACQHLTGMHLPDVALSSTQDSLTRLNQTSQSITNLSQTQGWVVVYCYPMTGTPGVALPDGWDSIPGARGCTPQSCAFRDHYHEMQALGAQVYGLSTQTADEQAEAATRLHLPFALLSDAQLAFANALNLPTFEVDGKRLIKRLTLITLDGKIQHCFYPVFPPDQNAAQVSDWLSHHV